MGLRSPDVGGTVTVDCLDRAVGAVVGDAKLTSTPATG